MDRRTKKDIERSIARIEEARKDPNFEAAAREFIAITTGKQPHKHRHD